MNKTNRAWPRPLAFLVVSVFFVMSGCFGPKEPPHYLDEGERYLVRLDRGDGSVRYDHPAEIDLETLKTALASVVARHEVSLLNRLLTQQKEVRGSAFTAEEVALLADRMKAAFLKATPQEQVAFFLTSRKNSMATQITSGVAFVKGGEIHLILANDQTSISSEQHPYLPRENPLYVYEPGSFQLLPQTHQRSVSDAAGRSLQGVAIDLAAPPAPARSEPMTSNAQEKAPAPSGASPLEAQFRLLKKLREENLITEEEYKEKKSELLRSIEVK